MSCSPVDIVGSSPQSSNNSAAPWLFLDPYAYQYGDITDHIRLIKDARQQPRIVKGEGEGQGRDSLKMEAAVAVEAGSVPVFEIEGSFGPGVAVANGKGEEEVQFELEGCSGGAKGVDLAKLTMKSPSGATTKTLPGTPGGVGAVAALPLAPGCLHVGGGGVKSPLGPSQGGPDKGTELFLAPADGNSTPSTPAALAVGPAAGNGPPKRGTTYRRPDVVTGKRTTTAIPAVTVTVPEPRRVTPPPPYTLVAPPSTPATPSTRTHNHHHQQRQQQHHQHHHPYQPEPPTPLSALTPHLRYHQYKRQSHSVPSSPVSSICSAPPSRTTSPAPPASDLDSILRSIDDERRCGRDSDLLAEVQERRRGGSRGSRAYAKYCDNN